MLEPSHMLGAKQRSAEIDLVLLDRLSDLESFKTDFYSQQVD